MRRGSRSWAAAMYFFGHHGLGPYDCFFCGANVTIDDDGPETLHIHHEDHDHTNNCASNLKPSHRRCHLSYHGKQGSGNRTTGKSRSDATKKAWVTRRERYGTRGKRDVEQ